MNAEHQAPDREATREVTLRATLQAAVQLRITDLQAMPPRAREGTIAWWAALTPNLLGARGDILMYGGGRQGQVGEVLSQLAWGLAALAHAPGGVTFAGDHWCVDHAACLDAAREAEARYAAGADRR